MDILKNRLCSCGLTPVCCEAPDTVAVEHRVFSNVTEVDLGIVLHLFLSTGLLAVAASMSRTSINEMQTS